MNYKTHLLIFNLIFIAIGFNSCKKEKGGVLPENNETNKHLDPALYGTWQDTKDTSSFYEFMPDSANTYWFLHIAINNFRHELLNPYQIDNGTIMFYNKTYESYFVRNDSLFIGNLNTQAAYVFKKVDHNTYNRKDWLHEIKIIADFPVPKDMVYLSSINEGILGIHGDTLYYSNNSYKIVSYNPFKQEFYNSFNHYTVDFILCHGQDFYWQFDKSLNKTKGFNDNFEKLNMTISEGILCGYRPSDSTFYFRSMFAGPKMYLVKNNASFKPLSNYFYASGTPDVVLLYKENQFIEKSGSFLIKTNFDGNKNLILKNYRQIPGHPIYFIVASSYGKSWIVAGDENNARLFHVDFE